jgi:hypothetical protein
MNPPVKLKDLVDTLKLRTAEHAAYINRQTGRVIIMDAVLVRAAKSQRLEGEELGDSSNLPLEQARAIVADQGKRFIPAPKPADFPEYTAMQGFISALADRTVAFELAQATKARGAFRQFKAALTHYGLRDAWSEYRHRALVDFALHWAQKNQLTCVEGSSPGRPQSQPEW